jgi:hypothetical protein
MRMGSNPNTSAPRRTSEWSAELPIKPKPMMATSQVRMAIVFLQRHRSSRGGQAAGGAGVGDSEPFRSRECPTKPAGHQDGPTIRRPAQARLCTTRTRSFEHLIPFSKEPNTCARSIPRPAILQLAPGNFDRHRTILCTRRASDAATEPKPWRHRCSPIGSRPTR